jgi:nuclear GTP-binding protein
MNNRVILSDAPFSILDLVPREVIEQWLKYLRQEFPTIAFKASTQSQRQHTGHLVTDSNYQIRDELATPSTCLGGTALLALLKNYCRNVDIKTSIRVGVIGYPNVGKSSLINSLKRSRVCGVAATPGFTKAVQEVHLDQHIKLIDCPGIVFANLQDDNTGLLLRNCMRVDQLNDPIEAVDIILKRCSQEDLMRWYSISTFDNAVSFLDQLARLRGKLKKGGAVDTVAMARTVLHDWNRGKLAFYTLPPANIKKPESSIIVHEWADEFRLDTLEDLESATLASLQPQSNVRGCVMENREPPTQSLDLSSRDELVWPDKADDEDVLKENGINEEMVLDESRSDSTVSQIKLAIKPKKHVSDAKPTKATTFSNIGEKGEDALNPQTNRQRRKMLKQMQKDRRREQNMESLSMVFDNEDYDFATDFVPIPPADLRESSIAMGDFD